MGMATPGDVRNGGQPLGNPKKPPYDPNAPGALPPGPAYQPNSTVQLGPPKKPPAPARGPAPAPASGPVSAPYGNQSGPGILESWFSQRAGGTDPGYEYSLNRGMRDINNQFAARGGYNSGAAIQGLSDFQANMGAQREGQLDTLAAGASGEHQRRLEDMFTEGLGLAGGQADTTGKYDFGAAGAMSEADRNAILLEINKAGVDPKTRQAVLDLLFNTAKGGASIAGGKAGI